jgi:hypothetical protein
LESNSTSLKAEVNSLAVLFPLIYLTILSFIGTRHYHYLIPLVPFFVFNVARVDFSARHRQFNFEACFTGFFGLLYLLGACLILMLKSDLLQLSVYFVFVVLASCSALCLYVFIVKAFSLRKVVPHALFFAIFISQYLSLSALAGGGVIWSTNRELKSLASSINADCKFTGVYLYGLSSKDTTVLRFYLDRPYILAASDDLRTLSKKRFLRNCSMIRFQKLTLDDWLFVLVLDAIYSSKTPSPLMSLTTSPTKWVFGALLHHFLTGDGRIFGSLIGQPSSAFHASPKTC